MQFLSRSIASSCRDKNRLCNRALRHPKHRRGHDFLPVWEGAISKSFRSNFKMLMVFYSQLLRDTFIFKIVPMLNPDGVIVGNYRCSLAGRDLNRNYKTVLKDSFPPIWHVRNMVRKWVTFIGFSQQKHIPQISAGTHFKLQRSQKLFDVEFSDKLLCTTNKTGQQ